MFFTQSRRARVIWTESNRVWRKSNKRQSGVNSVSRVSLDAAEKSLLKWEETHYFCIPWFPHLAGSNLGYEQVQADDKSDTLVHQEIQFKTIAPQIRGHHWLIKLRGVDTASKVGTPIKHLQRGRGWLCTHPPGTTSTGMIKPSDTTQLLKRYMYMNKETSPYCHMLLRAASELETSSMLERDELV